MSTPSGASSLSYALSGAVSTFFSSSATYPLSNVSTRLQVDQSGALSGSTIQILLKLFLEAGIAKGWYAGWSSNVISSVLMQFVFFYVKKALTSRLKDWKRLRGRSRSLDCNNAPQVSATVTVELTIAESLAIGFLAGMVAITITQPINVISTRVSIARGGNVPGFFETFKKLLHEEHWTVLYAGLLPSYILCLNPAIQHVAYDRLQRVLSQNPQLQLNQFVNKAILDFIFGAFSKLLATMITYPIITIKNRIQAKSTSETVSDVSSGPLNRIQALYRGLGAKLAQSVLTAALQFMLQEQLQDGCIKFTEGIIQHCKKQ